MEKAIKIDSTIYEAYPLSYFVSLMASYKKQNIMKNEAKDLKAVEEAVANLQKKFYTA
ncbi:hypothetical protein [Mariniphaga sp.]|uniref:hypothetical protein n=1 Tax=Mariniphaga sp. TaxID=1954475 RepID=UPI00356A3FF7